MKRYNGSGTVFKLSGKRRKPWTVQVFIDGKRQYLGSFETKREAFEFLDNFNVNDSSVYSTYATFSNLYEKWSEHHYMNLSDSAVTAYCSAYKHLEKIHNKAINAIKVHHLQSVFDNCIVGVATQQKMKNLINMVFKYAMIEDIVKVNYSEFIKIKKVDKKEKSIFTDEDMIKIKNEVNEGNDDAYIVYILLYTGFRIGELLDIKKCNVDLVNKTITGGSKTVSGKNRVVPIPDIF